jgi:hypothetical protein
MRLFRSRGRAKPNFEGPEAGGPPTFLHSEGFRHNTGAAFRSVHDLLFVMRTNCQV